MEVFLQFVSVDIPHTVEIAGSEPIGIEDLFGFGTTDAVQEQLFELIVRQTILLTRTDIVVVIPERLRHLGTANAFKQSSAVFDRCPFQHATNGDMEHNGVVVLEDRRIENAQLPQTDPSLDARIGDDAFRHGFGQSVMVVGGNTDRIAGTSPM